MIEVAVAWHCSRKARRKRGRFSSNFSSSSGKKRGSSQEQRMTLNQ